MKNETITRVILILEIGAVIFFHTLKSNSSVEDKIIHHFNQPDTIAFEQVSHVILIGK